MSALPIRGLIYASERVHNSNRRFGAATEYLPAYLIQYGRAARPLLFTPDQIRDAAERADANPEDCGVLEMSARPAADLRPEDLWLVPLMCFTCALLGTLAGWIMWGGA